MSMFVIAYVVLLSLWFTGPAVGVGWSDAVLGMAMLLFPVHVGVRFIEGRTGESFVQRRYFAVAWGLILTVVMISPVVMAATKSNGSAANAIAMIVGLVLIVAAPVIAALHLRVIWADRELPADGPPEIATRSCQDMPPTCASGWSRLQDGPQGRGAGGDRSPSWRVSRHVGAGGVAGQGPGVV